MIQHRTVRRFLRLTASTLAALGLLGHGLAMLLVSFLGTASAAAQPGSPSLIEICAAEGGIVLLDPDSGRRTAPADSGGDSGNRPDAPDHGGIDGCPVCSAFAQNGAADLPGAMALAGPPPRATVLPPRAARSAASRGLLTAQPRAPPVLV